MGAGAAHPARVPAVLAAQRDETADPNQELRALGAANLAAGFFQGFAISSSASRTPVAVAAGARSQLTPLVGAAVNGYVDSTGTTWVDWEERPTRVPPG